MSQIVEPARERLDLFLELAVSQAFSLASSAW
jgi:hypothetical protein